MIYLLKLSDLEPDFDYLTTLVGEKRRAQINKDKIWHAKLSHLASGLLYRFCLGHNYEDLIKVNEHGKPYGPEDICFNLSHAGDYAALYIGKNECGIDIEKIDKKRLALSPKAFTDEELAWIGDDAKKFFQLWTRKESISKALGMGFTYSFNKINTLQKEFFFNEKEFFTETFVYDNHIISVTEENNTPVSDMKILTMEEIT